MANFFSLLGVLVYMIGFSLASWDNVTISIEKLESCEKKNKLNMRYSDVFLDHGANNDVKLSLKLDINHDVDGPIMMEADLLRKDQLTKNEWVHHFNVKKEDLCPMLDDESSVFAQTMKTLGYNKKCPLAAGHYEKKSEPFYLPSEVENMLKVSESWKIITKFRKEKKSTYEHCAILYLNLKDKSARPKNYNFG